MRRLLPGILLIVLIFLQYRVWFEPGGVLAMLRLKHEVAASHALNVALQQRNTQLAEQINYLHSDAAVEARAREGLGMIRRDETFYQLAQS